MKCECGVLLLYLQESQLAHQRKTKAILGHEDGAQIGQPREMSAKSTQKRTFGGYDYEFVEPPHSTFQTACPICRLILREPYQVTCCGTSFCHTCIQLLQADNRRCPTCREDNFEMFSNKGLKRSLKQLQVYCTHRKDGCQWEGELGELDNHLNAAREECPLILTTFPFKLTLKNYDEMKRQKREWYSQPFYSHPRGYKMCLKVYVNGCGKGKHTHISVYAYLMRGEFDDQLKWPFRGCVVIQLCNQLRDKFHSGHTIDFTETTNTDVISRVTTGEIAESGWGSQTLIPQMSLSTSNCQYLKNNCLHFQIVAVELLSEPEVIPTELTLTNFKQHKIDGDKWYSLPFYTHSQGYKMRLRVDANGNGDGEGTHVSMFAYLMRGEYDHHLKWPFRGQVVIQLCNQLQDKYHRGYIIDFSKTTDAKVIRRVTLGTRAKYGWGFPTLIPHKNLHFNPTNNCQYLKNDCLHFQIVAVESLSEPEVIPTELTMTNFKEHKIDSDDWFSPPFYTHPQGYKMSLRVDANGNGDGEGTHLSVFAYLMRGEYDHNLKWPFRGHVVIQLCNQLQDKYHRICIIDFSKATDAKVISQVTSEIRAKRGWGCQTLIPHNDLNFSQTNNCQYLRHNCLHFEIVAVESLSEPGVLPTELTMTNFEQYKIHSDHWYSPPFYTHRQGYKMCLRVVANGWGRGKGTHISVFAYLLRGQFDDHLKWPFGGQVTIAMLNQLEDNNHTAYTAIEFTDCTESKYVGRVMEGERAPCGLGLSTFIAHTELDYNPTKNCQYLKYDCLRFRIIKVEL